MVTVLIASCFTAVMIVFDMVELTTVGADVDRAPVVATVTSSRRTFIRAAIERCYTALVEFKLRWL